MLSASRQTVYQDRNFFDLESEAGMPVVSLQQLLHHAQQSHYAVGYFEAWDLYSLEAVLHATETLRSPAILGFGAAVTEGRWYDQHGVEAMSGLARTLAQRSSVPTAVLFNEAQNFAQAVRGLAAGCNAVMLDSTHFSEEEHLAVTQQLTRVAHSLGAAVEAEVGHLANAADPTLHAAPTDPAAAAQFVAATGVDALAVSIGNVHLLAQGEATIDLERLDRLHRAVSVPLVIHGGTGFPRSAVSDAIRLGVAKFNVGTVLKQVFCDAVVAALGRPAGIHDWMGSRTASDILFAGQGAMQRKIEELIETYGSIGWANHW